MLFVALATLSYSSTVAGTNNSRIYPDSPVSLVALKPKEWISYGWAPDDSGESPIFAIPIRKIFTYTDAEIDVGPWSTSQAAMSVSDSLSTTSANIAAACGINASYWVFSAAVSASTARTFGGSEQVYRADSVITACKYFVQPTPINLARHLTAEAKDFLINSEPAAIASQIGALYPTQIHLGGVVRSIFIQKKTAASTLADFSANLEATANYLTASATASVSHTAELKKKGSSENIYVSTTSQGGDTAVWLKAKPDTLQEVQAEWAGTMNEQNLFPVDIKFGPIWDLIEPFSHEQAIKVEKFFLEKWAADHNVLKIRDDHPFAKPTTTTSTPPTTKAPRVWDLEGEDSRSTSWNWMATSGDTIGAARSVTLLEINPRPIPNLLILNTFTAGTWGAEERCGYDGARTANGRVALRVEVDSVGFKIQTRTGTPIHTYLHRLPWDSFSHITTEGDATFTEASAETMPAFATFVPERGFPLVLGLVGLSAVSTAIAMRMHARRITIGTEPLLAEPLLD